MVNYQVRIAETPIAGIPVMVNAQAQITDDNGSIAVSMESGRYYAISSGLSAVSFTSLYDSGGNFMARGDQVIDAQRLVSAGPACRIMTDGVKNIYFTTNNSTDDTKVISRAYKANRMYSVTGGAAPPDYFAPGTSGFTVPEGEFAQNGSLNGVWYFLGQSVLVTSDLPVCADSGTPVQCTTISQAQLRVPVDYTRAMVMRLTKMAFTLAKKGTWKGLSGSFATPFLSRGAAAMASMQKTLAGISTGPVYACDSQPAASCTQVSLTGFKRIAQTNFGRLFAKPVPRGLESITRLAAQEGRAFKTKVLDQLPDQVWVCPSNVTPSGY